MARPTNKSELLIAAQEQFTKLWKLLDLMTEEEQNATFIFEDRDRNLRDVLTHLYEWHQMMASWHKIGTLEGGIPHVPGEGYTWKTLPDLNRTIWEKYQNTTLSDAKENLKESHSMIIKLIEAHTNEELFSKSIYKWTKTTTLGAYFVSNTSSHYDWAIKKIKKHIKTYRTAKQE